MRLLLYCPIILLLFCFSWNTAGADEIDYSKPFPLVLLDYPISDQPYQPPVIQDVENIQINSDNTSQLQNEEMVFINPTNTNNVVAVWRDFRLGYRRVGIGYSFDGGQTWLDSLFDVPYRPWSSDPVLTVDNSGNYFACTLDYEGSTSQPSGLYVRKSTDGGMNWSGPVIAIDSVAGVFEDKQWITIDRTNFPSYGNIYITWTRFGFDTQIMLVASTDGNVSYSEPVQVSDQSGVQWSVPAVGPGGEVYVAWYNYGPSGIFMDVSTDQGQTFGTDWQVAGTTVSSENINGGILVFPYPALAIDINQASPYYGNLYIAYMNDLYGDMDIFFIRSEDDGSNWTAPHRINNDPPSNGADQFHPWISIDNNGDIHAVFYDRRLDPSNWLFNLYYTESTDGGITWSPNERISTQSSSPSDARLAGLIGEYIGLSAWDGQVQTVWTDTRNGNQDAFTARLGPSGACCLIDGSCLEIPEAECTASGGNWNGSGTVCLGDNNGNQIDDACEEVQQVPTLSQWGKIITGLMLLAISTAAILSKKKRFAVN